MAERPKALVTGASRGIGKAIAIALAKTGYDIAISARTLHSGEVRDNSLSVHRSDTRALPGSLDETREAIEAAGGQALMAAADLTDRAAVGQCAQLILDRWGHVDVLVHNGRYLGPGLMDVFADTPVEAYGKFFEAHCIAPIILTRALLPGMLEHGGGRVINITSSAAYETPPAPAGQGGWGLAYAVGKASGHPLVGTLHTEFKDRGLLAFNVQPGFVGTERNEIAVREYGKELVGAAPPAAIAAVVAWLVTDPQSASYAGTSIEAQDFCRERRLYPAWD
jgi:NAD(P)-dependent dehydrogenase (short-subunit alcohol dehydrogenase family)